MSLLDARLSANLSFLFGEWPFLDRFAAAADAGFRHVELLFPYAFTPDVIARALHDNDLSLVLFNAPPGDWEAGERGVAALPGREREFRDGIATALRYAEATGTRKLHVMAGTADSQDTTALSTYHANLREAAEQTAAAGVRILIEPINSNDMPGYFLDNFQTAAEIIDAFPLEHVGLQFDIYHCQKIHHSVMDWLAAQLPLIAHMQIAGIPDRHEPSEPALPLLDIFQLIERRGYGGLIGCEYRPAVNTRAGLKWIDDLQDRL
jgi:hydroxypyruvate isomerase